MSERTNKTLGSIDSVLGIQHCLPSSSISHKHCGYACGSVLGESDHRRGCVVAGINVFNYLRLSIFNDADTAVGGSQIDAHYQRICDMGFAGGGAIRR